MFSWNVWYQRPQCGEIEEYDDKDGNNDNLDNNGNDEGADHEDNYSSGVIWDGSNDVFQQSRESEWFFFHPLDGFAVMMIRIMIMIVMMMTMVVMIVKKGWWMDQK